ncbi:FtsB family cell division protein [Ancylobacter terrae]|uniref:FtsB family cell division protein n=1 Tax=Ancylobacter sp. sgz301288 TaxID=3342077 RepID=UPI00385DC9B8
MITRTRWRTFFQTLTLYLGATLLIGYFALQGYGGQYGLAAKRNFEHENAVLTQELAELRAKREAIAAKVTLLSPDRIDPDLLDEEARSLLNLVHRRDLVLLRPVAPVVSP